MESAGDETPRVKFLCSFAGSILPRPLDGKLRYVGGETRIVSLPHDITYEELMLRMRELFEGAVLLKYQQPDEDIDALVSVVNDDDVTNMMEECYKLGAGDSFTRLRIFLFSHPDHDASLFDTDERETERRYVDALNSPTDVPDFRKPPEISVVGQLDKLPLPEQFYNTIVFDRYHKEANVGVESCNGGLHSQRNCDVPLPPQYNLHHLAIPHKPSGHCSPASHQDHDIHMLSLPQMMPSGNVGGKETHQAHTPRYNEIETPWSPGYYSSGHQVHHDSRPISEFPSSPSASRYQMTIGELHDKCMDKLCEEYILQPESSTSHAVAHFTAPNHQAAYEHQPLFVDNLMWIQQTPVVGETAGYQGHLNHSQVVHEGSSICDRCHMTFQRSQALPETRYPDSRWRHGQPHLEHSVSGNEISQFSHPCAECFLGGEAFMLNPDAKLDHAIHAKDQNEHTFFNDSHTHERGWVVHQLNHRAEEPRTHLVGTERVNEHYNVDGSTDIPFSHSNSCESHSVSSNCINRDAPRYLHSGAELGNEGLGDQNLGIGLQMHRPVLEDRGIRYGNLLSAYGTDNMYQPSHGSASSHALSRKAQNTTCGGPSCEVLGFQPQSNGTASAGFLRGTQERSPRFSGVGVDDQNPWIDQFGTLQKMNPLGFDAAIAPQYLHDHVQKMNVSKHNFFGDEECRGSSTAGLARGIVDTGNSSPSSKISGAFSRCAWNSNSLAPESIQLQSDFVGIAASPGAMPLVSSSLTLIDEDLTKRSPREGGVHGEVFETEQIETLKEPNTQSIPFPVKSHETGFDVNNLRTTDEDGETVKLLVGVTGGTFEQAELSVECLNYLPELIASVKMAAFEGAEEVKARIHGNDDAPGIGTREHASFLPNPNIKNSSLHELGSANPHMDPEVDSDGDCPKISKIESTKAEEEALARGLQTIKNDDLEEIRELGSGTYGAVYHGKWKGSDVAIKRIKASCFAGKPSERERLIADFWKEALILSSLHHPNVVSFYGIVRDGPDGSLATVTEFMVNGSLKQFLQKKDRTIDRRKRLIIAMDSAFGMEYLHGKNIVHFDLKCENLLVNMRDPQRPVCKIGDLGLSKVKQHTLVSGGVRGTLPWMAPELLSGKTNMVTEKIDVYSFGIVMWELLTGEEPYADMHCASIIGGIVNNSLRPQIPTWCDPEWRSLMESCWSSDPGERPSSSEISQRLRKMSAAINVK